MTTTSPALAPLPAWLPDHARLYLRHVEEGIPLRALARAEGCHASTVLRRVRQVEARRDDPLVDEALARLGHGTAFVGTAVHRKDETEMTAPIRPAGLPADEELVAREGRRILRRLAEPSALLLIADDMDKAVVLRGTVRTAVTERALARVFALKDWIQLHRAARVTSYEITVAGRAALKRMIEEETLARGLPGGEAAGSVFAGQHRDWGERAVREATGQTRRLRANLAESPLAVLARRRDAQGQPFLGPELVAAGERLREDFELAQIGPRVAQNWERFLTCGERAGYRPDLGPGSGGSDRARERLAAALRDLGPGLGDMVLRCCCFLEGLEAAERRLGWSARSGKIVLRIALMRLKRHYDETSGGTSPLIG